MPENQTAEITAAEIATRLRHAATTAQNDDVTIPRSIGRQRHCMRVDAMMEAAEFLEGLGAMTTTSQTARWDRHFLRLALDNAAMSKDPRTQVGSVIVGPDREVRSAGFNGFPRGITDTFERLHDRETKMKLIVHGEMNAILNAARIGISTKNCSLYLAATDETGLVWGGPPCTRCVVEIIQAGISEIISFPVKAVPSRWHDDLAFARTLLAEASIAYRQIADA